MLDKWLQDLRALLVTLDSSSNTAITNSVPGCDAASVGALDTPTDPDNGYFPESGSLALAPRLDPEMTREVLRSKSLVALHEAIELHAQVMNGSGICTKFLVIAETVDANLETGNDKRSLNLLTSADLTPWDLVGFSAALTQSIYSGTI